MQAMRGLALLCGAALSVPTLAGGAPPYAAKAPLREPALFAPGVISTGTFDSHIAFTPDGATLYFARSTANFNFWTIMVSHYAHGRWSVPQVAPFSGQYADADPFITADGERFYFISRRPATPGGKPKTDTDIWVMRRTAAGWGEPRHLGDTVNSADDEWYPTLTREGTLYFGSGRPGGKGQTDLYRAPRAGEDFGPAENLGAPLNTAADEYEPWISPDENTLIFMAAGRPDSSGGSDLYISHRRDGAWSEPKHLEGGVNSSAKEYAPKLSPDGRYFFWASTRNFTDTPLSQRMDTAAYTRRLDSPGNSLGDIYYIDADVVLGQ